MHEDFKGDVEDFINEANGCELLIVVCDISTSTFSKVGRYVPLYRAISDATTVEDFERDIKTAIRKTETIAMYA